MSQMKAGDLAAARRTFQRLADEAPEVAAVRIALGRVYLQEKDYPAALDEFQEALKLEPNSAIAITLSARAREQLGDTQKALLEYEQASEIDPSLGFPQMRLSRLFADEKDYEESIRRLRETLDHNPQQVRVRMLLAEVLEKSGDAAAARAELERVLEIEPDHLQAANKLAQSALNEKDFATARSHFERAIKAAPDKAGPQLGYAVACAALGEHRVAIEAFTKAQGMNPNLPLALRIADSHVALKQPEDALRVLHQAAQRSRNPAVVHKRIGDIYVSMGRYAQAVEEYRAAVLHQPEIVERDPELKSLLEGGGNPELLARNVQEKLAAIPDEPDGGTGDARSSRLRRFGRMRAGLRQAD
jgi:tetratricopeptide (TPR) repeat protein